MKKYLEIAFDKQHRLREINSENDKNCEYNGERFYEDMRPHSKLREYDRWDWYTER